MRQQLAGDAVDYISNLLVMQPGVSVGTVICSHMPANDC